MHISFYLGPLGERDKEGRGWKKREKVALRRTSCPRAVLGVSD